MISPTFSSGVKTADRVPTTTDTSPADALPLIVPLAVRERTVLNGHAIAERASKQPYHGRREGDLGHHEQRATAVATYPLGQPQIDFGFPAAGHPLEHGDVKRPEVAALGKRVERHRLLDGERSRYQRRCHHGHGIFERAAFLFLRMETHQSPRGQPGQHIRRDAPLAQFRHRQARNGRPQDAERSTLPLGQSNDARRRGVAIIHR